MGSIAEQYQAIRLAVAKAGLELQQQTESVAEAAFRLGETQAEVRRLLANGTIRTTMVGRRREIPSWQIDRLLGR